MISTNLRVIAHHINDSHERFLDAWRIASEGKEVQLPNGLFAVAWKGVFNLRGDSPVLSTIRHPERPYDTFGDWFAGVANIDNVPTVEDEQAKSLALVYAADSAVPSLHDAINLLEVICPTPPPKTTT